MTESKRTRLSPHARRRQLLDCAQVIIHDRGLSCFTMDALATEAGVSNPLIYKYFDTRLELLQELLAREFTRFNDEIKARLSEATNYHEVVRIFIATNFDEATKGDTVFVLQSQPDIFSSLEKEHMKADQKVTRFLIEKLIKHYSLNQKQAKQITVLASGASRAAAEQYNQFGGNRDALIDGTLHFIFGGIRNFKAKVNP